MIIILHLGISILTILFTQAMYTATWLTSSFPINDQIINNKLLKINSKSNDLIKLFEVFLQNYFVNIKRALWLNNKRAKSYSNSDHNQSLIFIVGLQGYSTSFIKI